MKISSFHLINDGYTGVKVESVESISQGNLTILDTVIRTRLFPIPDTLRIKINKLKYFFLNLTHHWIEPYDKCFDISEYDFVEVKDQEPPKSYMLLQALMNHTKITGIRLKNAGFCITGTIEGVENKKMGLSTPFITEEDDVSFFMEAMDRIHEIVNDLADTLASRKALEINERDVLMSKGFKEDILAGLTRQQMLNMVFEDLTDRGLVTILDSDGNEKPKEITDGTSKTKLHQKTGSIDSHRMPEAEEKEEDDEKLSFTEIPVPPVAEKKPVGKGSLASEGKFPDLDTGQIRPKEEIPEGAVIEDMEYSANMGIPIKDEELINQGEW